MKTGGKLDFQGKNGLPREGINIELPDYVKKGEEGQGFEPTEPQLSAMNSGITANKVEKLDNLPTFTAIDDALSASSENPVQNKTIYGAIGDLENTLQTINTGAGVL